MRNTKKPAIAAAALNINDAAWATSDDAVP